MPDASIALDPTNCANDAGPSVHVCRLVGGVETALPFELGAIGKMIQCVRHLAGMSFF